MCSTASFPRSPLDRCPRCAAFSSSVQLFFWLMRIAIILPLRVLYALASDLEIFWIDLDPDEITASLYASHPGSARAHKRVHHGFGMPACAMHQRMRASGFSVGCPFSARPTGCLKRFEDLSRLVQAISKSPIVSKGLTLSQMSQQRVEQVVAVTSPDYGQGPSVERGRHTGFVWNFLIPFPHFCRLGLRALHVPPRMRSPRPYGGSVITASALASVGSTVRQSPRYNGGAADHDLLNTISHRHVSSSTVRPSLL